MIGLKKIAFLAAFLLCWAGAAAQVEFVTNAARMVEAGETFRVEFAVTVSSANVVPSAFAGPDFAGLNVLAGPVPSNGPDPNRINGQPGERHTWRYTYLLVAPAEGRITIPSASVTVEGKSYTTRPLQIDVVATDTSAGPSPGASDTSAPAASRNTLAPDDVLVRIVPSRTTVYRGEPIRVQLKLYTRVAVVGLRNARYPAFNGFWSQELAASEEVRQETYNNKLYEAQVVREFLLFPRQAGTLSIEPFALSVVARLVTPARRQSQLDDFYGGGPTSRDIPVELTAGPIPITVRELPAGAPAGFSGAVGQFRLDGGTGQSEIPANSSARFDVRISGSGNLPLIEAPAPVFPSSFETYAVQTTDDYAPAGTGMTGGRTFSTPFIPRAEGEYTLPALSFSYFDPAAGRYQTLSLPEQALRIGKDTGGSTAAGPIGGVSREDVRILGEDIRFIRLGNPGLRRAGSLFLGSGGYWAVLALLAGAFAGALIYLRRLIRLRGDTPRVRNRKARKVALRRLKAAESHMRAGDSARFYDEMLKALWGYLGDKLNLPAADLSRERVQAELTARGVEPDLAGRCVAAVAECEYRRYAPSDKSLIGEVYHHAVELIAKMESKNV